MRFVGVISLCAVIFLMQKYKEEKLIADLPHFRAQKSHTCIVECVFLVENYTKHFKFQKTHIVFYDTAHTTHPKALEKNPFDKKRCQH